MGFPRHAQLSPTSDCLRRCHCLCYCVLHVIVLFSVPPYTLFIPVIMQSQKQFLNSVLMMSALYQLTSTLSLHQGGLRHDVFCVTVYSVYSTLRNSFLTVNKIITSWSFLCHHVHCSFQFLSNPKNSFLMVNKIYHGFFCASVYSVYSSFLSVNRIISWSFLCHCVHCLLTATIHRVLTMSTLYLWTSIPAGIKRT